MTTEKRDLVIVGGGPAGLSSALYARRYLIDAVTLEREAFGGQMVLTTEVDNYPGVPHVDAYTLADTMRSQAVELGARVETGTVQRIEHDGATGRFWAHTDTSVIDAASVIFCGGAQPRRAGFAGEERFIGHGVSYCATCDGMFWRGKQVFVIGGGNSAVEEALFLARLASKVTLLVRKDHLRAQAALVKELEQSERIEVRFMTSVVALDGGELPSSIELRDNATGETHVERFEEGSFGVFVMAGRVPETGLLEGLVELDQAGYAVTDERMATKTPGLYVAGDCRKKPLRQIVTAASDGAVAAASAASYLGLPVEG